MQKQACHYYFAKKYLGGCGYLYLGYLARKY